MAWTVKLTDGTTTVDLNDGTATFLNLDGLYAPPPDRNQSLTGPSLLRHGEDIVLQSYGNRTVSISLGLKATAGSALGSLVGTIWDILRKAEEFHVQGFGTQVQLQYQWEGATSPVYFNVLTGAFDLTRNLHSPYLLIGTRIRAARMELLCEPFAVGTAESVENYIANPSFEIGTGTANWTADLGTGTAAWTTAQSKYGTASLGITRSAGTEHNWMYQALTTAFTGGDNISASVWIRPQALSGTLDARMRLLAYSTAGVLLGTIGTAVVSTVGTAFVQAKITGQVCTTDTGTVYCHIGIFSTSSGTGTAQFDGILVVKSATVPNAFVSGRDIGNHFDNASQVHTNYVDIYDVPGDVPAAAQIRVAETEAMTDMWIGARHAGRMRDGSLIAEGESFTGAGWTSTINIWGTHESNGSVGLSTAFDAVGSAASPTTSTYNITTPSIGQYKVLARVGMTGTGTMRLGVGWVYGSASRLPSATAHYVKVGSGTYTYYDLGVFSIPPVTTPIGGTIGSLTLRLAYYMESTVVGTTGRLVVDYIHLMPMDMGAGYVSKTGNADVVLVDSRSNPRALWLLNTADKVQSFPANQQGDPPKAHPKGSRYYILGDPTGTDIGTGFAVKITYVSRFLHVGT